MNLKKTIVYKMLEILSHCLYQSLRHPRKIIKQISNPTPVTMSPIPWWGSCGLIIVGIICWCLGCCFSISGLDEAGRVLVYTPIGNLFGMSFTLASKLPK
jgi:hypothetical protein